jgi:hypothetical protein
LSHNVIAMLLFDLLFLLLFFAAILSLGTAAWLAFRHQSRRARHIVVRVLICTIVYFAAVMVTSLVLPQRSMKPGDEQCFDDLCVSVEGFVRMPEGPQTRYEVNMRILSRARGTAQRENNLAMYLTDDQNRRYDPVPENSYQPFNVLLRPGESVLIARAFRLPVEARGIGAVIAHEGGFPIAWFIIGYDAWFRKPPLIRLP